LYFTQALGIAFGIDPKKLGFGKELVAGLPVIKSKLNGQLVAG
jgi:heterodisulfide reductase subunit B